MSSSYRRAFRALLSPFLVVGLLVSGSASAKTSSAKDAVAQRPRSADPGWLYRGSDIPPDRAWTFGELKNGLRYAVRRNGVPPRQVSIRIAIDAGSLMERDSERGFAHFNEHLSFRGSRYVPDGEAKRLWQRLGATFGSDTNATTTPTQTIYKIDLPNATVAGLDESVKALSGMMMAPDISQAEVDAERRTVLAEMREGKSAAQRIADATRETFFAGQPLGNGAPIGTTETLGAATPATLRAFHDRWYRPDKTVIVIAGDADPAVFEDLIRKYFSDWRANGPAPADVSFGTPNPNADRARVFVEPGAPVIVSMAILRPWHFNRDTIAYNRGNLIRGIAARVINRRLESRARAGGSFLQASIDDQKISRSVDGTFIQVVPIGDDWQAAVRDVRATIADALSRPASQADIDREAKEFAAALDNAVEVDSNDSGADLADNLIEAVNIRETVASPEVARDVFSAMPSELTPAKILAATRELMTGTPLRAVLTLPAPDPTAKTKLLAALTETVAAGPPTDGQSAIGFDRLPALGAPGTIVKTSSMPDVGLTIGEFANGVRLVLYPHPAETGRVLVQARFGRGYQALPTDRQSPAWAGEAALIASGIGDLNQEQIDRMTSARKINMNLDILDDAFVLKADTRPADLADQLKLMAAKLAFPRWDPAPVLRARAGALLGYDSYKSSASGVLGKELPGLLHGGDPRWAVPSRADIEALTPESFKALWAPILASGPIEVSIYGDIDIAMATKAAAATFGALPPRKPAMALSPVERSITPNTAPLIEHHDGPADQAAAIVAWPTGGGLADASESHRLDVLAQIFTGRLFDKLREGEGASYSPSVGSQWPDGFSGGGNFVALSQLQPRNVDAYFAMVRSIAADLASTPVTQDELNRAILPMKEMIIRAATGSTFWLSQLGGVSFDPRKATALKTLASDYGTMTPAQVQETAKRWLRPDRMFTMAVLPAK